jgi:hypothetical protein
VLEHVLFSRLDVTMYAETCILLGRDMRHQQVKMPRGAVMYYRANLFLFSQSVCVCVHAQPCHFHSLWHMFCESPNNITIISFTLSLNFRCLLENCH